MFWEFKLFSKIIGTLFIYAFSVPIVMICLPFYLPYYFIKEHINKKKALAKRRRGRIPMNSPRRSKKENKGCRVKDVDDLWWIDEIEAFDAFMDD